MAKIWKLKPKIPDDVAGKIIRFLSQNPHPIPLPEGEGDLQLLSQLLFNRGLTDKNQIDEFLNPQYERLHSPFLFKDMEKAVERIWKAIDENQKIIIYGDYDADAVTANAVLRQTFLHLNHKNIESYIPDRFTEGYGVNLDALIKLREEGASLIITVDCGTNSTDAADFCIANDIDFIITDHHEIIGELPNAFALINPKNSDDSYPDSNITGVGVAFKIAQAILKNQKSKIKNQNFVLGWEKWLLDLAAIGTVADCHSLLGENRILVRYGLKVLQKTKWMGLKALMESAGLFPEDGPLGKPQRSVLLREPDTYTLGFIIAPRLNAAGRLEHANTALDLLLETDPISAKAQAIVLDELNRKRQDATARILSEAREKALLMQDRKILVLMSEGWHKGVVGLVAGKIAEEFYKPTIVLHLEGELATGSGRSVGEFNMIQALRFSSMHLEKFGGHKAAVGLSLRQDNFEVFYKNILDYASSNLVDDESSSVIELEAELGSSSISYQAYDLIASMEPFGVGNPKPKFAVYNAQIISQKQVGKENQHLQLQIKVGEKTIPAIAFNFRPITEPIINIACELMEDEWNGKKQIKLRVIDLWVHSNMLAS